MPHAVKWSVSDKEAELPSVRSTTQELFTAIPRADTLSVSVTERLERLIHERHLEPGDRMPSERELAEQFGVSRTVVREAVRALVARGLLEVRAGSGTLVKAPTARTVVQSVVSFMQVGRPDFDYGKIHEVRRVLELEIAGLAAQRRTKDDLHNIWGYINRMEETVGDRQAFSEADVAFHVALAQATQNQLFVILLDSIAGVMFRVRELGNRVRSAPGHAIAFHKKIYRQVKAGDSEQAKQMMLEHLLDSEAVFNRAMQVEAKQ